MLVHRAVQMLSMAAAIALLAACSGGTAVIAHRPSSGPYVLNTIRPSRYACPATGPLKYVSDGRDHAIDVFAGKFAEQAPCAQLALSSLQNPQGLFVQPRTHDLYVANTGAGDVIVFHRGDTTPYNTYSDPSNQAPQDVTVASDGTVIASNVVSAGVERGSISTWIGGPNGGIFVGNFPMPDQAMGGSITVQANGTVYYNDLDGTLWSLSCPGGACGPQTQVAGVSFVFSGGLGSDMTDDLLAIDQGASRLDTFELPDPTPSTIPLTHPAGMAINRLDHHLFVTDPADNTVAEYTYPGGALIGTIHFTLGGVGYGIAVDPGHALK
ncbi:MAG TPA: hypothetical protein VID24_03050 [Candidatus Eremiobacteraceae bacterium]